MLSRDEMIREITRIIDESTDPWRKTAFYSDPDVQQILDAIYERWESSGREGIPLDHATDEEVEFLYSRAINVRPNDSRNLMKKFFRRAILPLKKGKD